MSTNKLRFSKRKVKEAGAAYLFIAPMLIGLLIFYFFAFIQNIYFSFNKVGAFGPPTFIGWENYIRLVNDPLFWTALKNTLSVSYTHLDVYKRQALEYRQNYKSDTLRSGLIFRNCVDRTVLFAHLTGYTFLLDDVIAGISLLD